MLDLLGGAGSASLGKKAATVSRELISLGDDLAEAAGQGITKGAREAVDELVPDFDLDHVPRGAPQTPRALLAPVKIQRHHIFPQKFRDFFSARGVDIDKFTVELSQGRHLRSVHGRGDVMTPGRFNQRWADFIEANPNATAKDVYQFGGMLMDEFGLSKLPIVPYR